MLEARQTSQLLHSALASWRGAVIAFEQAEGSAIIFSERRDQR